MSSDYYFGQCHYTVEIKLDIKDNIICKFKLKTDLRNDHFINFYYQLILNQELPPLAFLITLFSLLQNNRSLMESLQKETNGFKPTPKSIKLPENYCI